MYILKKIYRNRCVYLPSGYLLPKETYWTSFCVLLQLIVYGFNYNHYSILIKFLSVYYILMLCKQLIIIWVYTNVHTKNILQIQNIFVGVNKSAISEKSYDLNTK